MLAIEALRRYTPGCKTARLRNFGMTIGIRDTRKIDAVYTEVPPAVLTSWGVDLGFCGLVVWLY